MDMIIAHEGYALTDEFNNTGDRTFLGHCLHRLYECAVDSYSNDVAVICADSELNYRGLNDNANRLARALLDRGIGRGSLIGVALDRSIDFVVAVLAVLKTGAAYVPIDLNFPARRISWIIDDANPDLVITRTPTPENLWAWKASCLSVDEARGNNSGVNSGNLKIEVGGDDLAYVIYTSGSTGEPKGVEVSHGAVCNLLCSMRREPGCGAADRLLAITTFSFDIAVLELFLPLVCGATTVIAKANETLDTHALLGLMERHRITMMQGTPTTWQMLLESGWHGQPRLAKILCGGEALPRRLAERLLVCGDSVWNLYGPTETTVWSSIWKVSQGDNVVIGRPIANTQLYVLGPDLTPVPTGCSGELCIGGAGVSQGYRNKPQLTRSRFVDNPFHAGTMYRTGDMARFLTPDKLTVLGRADDQVKLRGYRIELGDIEAAITYHEDISRALVVTHDERLVAYCVREHSPQADGDDINHMRGSALEEWAGVWDQVYKEDKVEGDEVVQEMFNIAGWRNSYDGAPFSSSEMRDWQLSSVQRILSYGPKRVFEIGSGTGLMLFSIAPHCSAYHAVDSSKQAVEITRRHLSSLPHVICEHCPAHTLPTWRGMDGAFDTVIINSVVQYFPSIDYLLSVLEWATKAVGQGRVYLGDLRSLSFFQTFHSDVIDCRSNGQLSPSELSRRTKQAMQSDSELVISPTFFANLQSLIPRINHVEITLRNGRYINEMTRYRFDVTLHIGAVVPQDPVIEREWRDGTLDQLTTIDEYDKVLRLNNIPNGRLREVHDRLAVALGDVVTNPLTASWIDPYDLTALAAQSGRQMALVPSLSGGIWAFDALLWYSGKATPDLSLHSPEAMVRKKIGQYANVPMALPVPVMGIKSPVRPTTELEGQILTIWAEILGYDSIGIEENFFEIGGDSLRAVRLQTDLENLLHRPVSSAIIFKHFTIKALAAYFANTEKPYPKVEPPALRIPMPRQEDIAIISMACRLPGGVNTPEEYWDLLDRGGDGISEIPQDRWDSDALYDPDPGVPGKSYCRQGGFVSGVDRFDASFFGISPREARSMDPTQRVMLESCWEAFERAGYTMEGLRGSQTGVFIGVSTIAGYRSHGLCHVTRGSLDALDGYTVTGTAGGTMSGRVSYTFGLQGPAMTVDTACSSSLVTTHLAATALRNGECDVAISGGISLMLSPELHVEFSRLRGMSPDGRCRAFSADTEGTGWSEGSAVVLLKRCSDAQRDGDTILAVLRGTAVNHGGRSAASLTSPSGLAQERLIRTALAMSHLEPSDMDYVEAHGTGTKLGDPIEGAALAEVFGGSHSREEPLWIGSAKSNIGHTQAAAGLAGVIKVVLALQHNLLPATLHVNKPTPAVDWENGRMALVCEKRSWVPNKSRLRRAGVSSFGIGGTNAHAIIEEPPSEPYRSLPITTRFVALPPTVPILLSGHTSAALRQQAQNLHRHLKITAVHENLGDVAYTLAAGRTHFRQRVVLLVQDKEELQKRLASFVEEQKATSWFPESKRRSRSTREQNILIPRVALLFTGQGSQLPGMGKDLCAVYPLFYEALQDVASRFTNLERPLLDVMWADPGSEAAGLLSRTDFTQSALFALEVALWRLWDSWGIRPELVFGHSIGEIVAAHVAGIFNLSDACRLVEARGQLMQALPGGGTMVSLEATAVEVENAIEALGFTGQVEIASLNTPSQTVVSGAVDPTHEVMTYFAERDRKVKALKVSHAFHSNHMDGMLTAWQSVIGTVQFRPPKLAVISGLTGRRAEVGELQHPEYWVHQARRAVRFTDGIVALEREGVNVFLELGPRPVLSGLGAECLAGKHSVTWVPSLIPGKHSARVIQRSLADLHSRGVPVDWRGYFKPFGGQLLALPTYAFQKELLWSEAPPLHPEINLGRKNTGHGLFDGGIEIASTGMLVFSGTVMDDALVWLQEHKVIDTVLMPGAVFFECMRAAGHAVQPGAWELVNGLVQKPLAFMPNVRVRLQVTVGPPDHGTRQVQVYGAAEGGLPWTLHAEGSLVPAHTDASGDVTPFALEGAQKIDLRTVYRDFDVLGYHFGPRFRCLKEAWVMDEEVWARTVSSVDIELLSPNGCCLDPALLQSAIHSVLLAHWIKRTGDNGVFVPFKVEGVSLPTTKQSEIWVRVFDFERDGEGFQASIDVYSDQGANIGRLHRVHYQLVDRVALQCADLGDVNRLQFRVAWHPVDADHIELRSGVWGLQFPAGEVKWAEKVKTSLVRAGIKVIDACDLNDAKRLDGLLCLWDSSADILHQAHDFTAKALTQLQAAAKTEFAKPLVWVTRQAVGTGIEDRVTGLGAGALWGLMRTARNEHPELTLRLIDLDGDEGEPTEHLLARALMLRSEPECALRRGHISAPRLQYLHEADTVPRVQKQWFLRPDGAVLITGGFGGLGRRVARWLVSTHGIRDLVITSRGGMNTPGAKEQVDELAELGANVTVVASDSADFQSVRSVVGMFNKDRPLRGAVHAAGVLDDGILSALTPHRCDAVFRPKVDGAWYLHHLTQDMELDVFMMFSSISGILGMPGQGNYAAANAFLDALAHQRRSNGLAATSVAWGPWEGQGMIAGLGETGRARLTQLGLDSIGPAEGLQLLELAARGDYALTVAAALDPNRLRSSYDRKAGVPPLFRLLLRGKGEYDRQLDGERFTDLCNVLRSATPQEQATTVMDAVRETVAKTLGFMSPEDVHINQPFQDLGIDSLTAVLTRNQLAELTGLALPASIVFDHPNAKALAQFLLSKLLEPAGDPSQGSSGALLKSNVAPAVPPGLNIAAIMKGCLDPMFRFDDVVEMAARPKAIFITGATGFVGAFLLHELLESNIPSYCLVRADNASHAKRRLVSTLESYGLWKPGYATLVNSVVGDMTQPLLGLDEKAFEQLAIGVDAICHAGALVDWMRPLKDYVGPNIVSMHEVLRLSSLGRPKTVHLISTAATLPKYMGYEVVEGDQEYGYATSKWIAERMLAAARWRGAKASVYRLPFVTASICSGYFRRDRGDFLHNLIVGSIEMGSFPSINADLSAVLPVDYLCKTISTLMTNVPGQTGDYDFVNSSAPSFNAFFNMISVASGVGEVIQFAKWQERALAWATANPTSHLARIAAVVDGLTEESVAAMFECLPMGEHVFDTNKDLGPLLDDQFVEKYLSRTNTA
ncbi:Acyl transferase/acyl hydrolase/lysophospholipase [Penicillium griseofulvum]|uniref:Acyl transferase/acyl hydrolase/lysophospholipase n=1 Tax=Penicillium patulum TaxID=5078 RepID=A0A135LKC6_PENPA|nr:Acyl transferase/acyl hydrolase/lysophospholipase [Penicillium griseofulvum]KXG49399.1 Acyl transferase/acyl hydrolase/lysophospholipase [Penicillium griseofulvum]